MVWIILVTRISITPDIHVIYSSEYSNYKKQANSVVPAGTEQGAP